MRAVQRGFQCCSWVVLVISSVEDGTQAYIWDGSALLSLLFQAGVQIVIKTCIFSVWVAAPFLN